MFKKAGNDSVKINWSLQSVTWKWKIYLEILNELYNFDIQDLKILVHSTFRI